MTPVRSLGLLAVALGTVVAAPVPVLACACAPVVEVPSQRSARERLPLDREVAVFSGRVVEISLRDDTVTLDVTQVWKGDVTERVTMWTRHTSCDWVFELGETYLVFGYGDSIETMRAEQCTLTARLTEAARTLALLEAAGHSPRRPRP